MSTQTKKRYGVRVGDDGRWRSEHVVYECAHQAALDLAEGSWNGKAQIVDFQTGQRVVVFASWGR